MRLFGLIGFPLSHSFSKEYFTRKFTTDPRLSGCSYTNFELPAIDEFAAILKTHPNLEGLNVTRPYKQSIIPFLDALDQTASAVGAVNTIRIDRSPGHDAFRLTGFNTDVTGFSESLTQWTNTKGIQALVLGTGGAARAVCHVLKQLNVPYVRVSRHPEPGELSYSGLNRKVISERKLMINTTPLGTSPNTEEAPPLPYEFLSPEHLLYDLVYNPEVTRFMREGMAHGALVKNGLDMLRLQAEASWRIWNREG